jgi:hypothetical protein
VVLEGDVHQLYGGKFVCLLRPICSLFLKYFMNK